MINCIAVDDESLALDLLEDNIKQVPFLNLVKRCKNAFEAIDILQKEKIDLVFLDIQMPGLTGIQLLKSLKSPVMVILVTAYEKYALDGFELDVVDYLVKPFLFERFLKAVNKAQQKYNLNKQTLLTKHTDTKDYIFVNSEYNLIKITIDDISYIEGLKDYIKIYLASSPKPIITRMSIKAIEEKLPVDRYIRVHKSFVISIDKIVSIRKSRIRLGSAEVPISDHYREGLFKIIDPKSLQE